MKYDELLVQLGEFGKYQKIRWFLVASVTITSVFHSMNMVFVGPSPEHHCKLPNVQDVGLNLTHNQLVDILIPCLIYDDGVCIKRDKCSMYNHSSLDWSPTGPQSVWIQGNGTFLQDNMTKETCQQGWQYSQEYYQSTIVTEWDLVCDHDWVTELASTIFFSGRLVGAFLLGYLSDKFGRRPVFFVSLFCQVLSGCLAAASQWASMFLLVYFFQGVFQVTVFLSVWILGTELVGPSQRKYAAMGNSFVYTLGQIILTGVAYGIRDWRWIETTISVLPVCFFVYWWMVNALVYYGLNLNTKNLHGDPYLNFFIAACVEVPGLAIAMALLDIVGRRWLLIGFMWIGAAACIGTAFVPVPELIWLALVLSMLGKFAITASYAVIYLMAAEVFPTVVRSTGMGVASVFARVGGMMAPQFLYLGNFWPQLPLLVFGCMSFFGGSLCLLLPETKGKALPQSMEEMTAVTPTSSEKKACDEELDTCEALMNGKEIVNLDTNGKEMQNSDNTCV